MARGKKRTRTIVSPEPATPTEEPAAEATAWTIRLAPTALEMLREIRDQRVLRQIARRIETLAANPEASGKALTGPLTGYYSSRAASQRFRIIYQLQHETVVVLIVAIGRREENSPRDIYQLAQRLVRLGLLDVTD